jgi:hypothetical protein
MSTVGLPRVALVAIALALCWPTAGCSTAPAPRPSVATGTVRGEVQACFGYAGPPPVWVVTVTANQGDQISASQVIHRDFARKPDGSYKDNSPVTYSLALPPGTYEIKVAADILIKPVPVSLGQRTVESGRTTTADLLMSC